MDKEYLISVIIPVYNPGKYLRACLDSVLKQSFDEYEIILVDDGSIDGSSALCDEYERNNVNIHCIHQPNQGQIAAREHGVLVAHGEFILFLDSDDELTENALSDLANIIENNNSIDMLCYRWRRMDEEGKDQTGESAAPLFDEGVVKKELFFKMMLSGSELNSVCIKLVRKNLFSFNEHLNHITVYNGEDLLQTIELFDRSNIIYYTNSVFYLYRNNSNSVSNKYKPKRFKNLDIVRPQLFDYMNQRGYATEENIELFYNLYLSIVVKEIIAYLLFSNSSKKEMQTDFSEIIRYKHVKILKNRLFKTKHTSFELAVLCFFYLRLWHLLRLASLLYKLRIHGNQ